MKVIKGVGEGASSQCIDFVEKNLQLKLPESFLNCIRQVDSGVPEYPLFRYLDPDTKRFRIDIASFISFLPENSYNILRTFFMLPEFFPKKLVPIMENGGGDYICFDYSIDGFQDKDPPVVLWLHENSEGQDIVDLAINFQRFLSKLEPEEKI